MTAVLVSEPLWLRIFKAGKLTVSYSGMWILYVPLLQNRFVFAMFGIQFYLSTFYRIWHFFGLINTFFKILSENSNCFNVTVMQISQLIMNIGQYLQGLLSESAGFWSLQVLHAYDYHTCVL